MIRDVLLPQFDLRTLGAMTCVSKLWRRWCRPHVERRQQALIDALPMAYVRADRDGCLYWWHAEHLSYSVAPPPLAIDVVAPPASFSPSLYANAPNATLLVRYLPVRVEQLVGYVQRAEPGKSNSGWRMSGVNKHEEHCACFMGLNNTMPLHGVATTTTERRCHDTRAAPLSDRCCRVLSVVNTGAASSSPLRMVGGDAVHERWARLLASLNSLFADLLYERRHNRVQLANALLTVALPRLWGALDAGVVKLLCDQFHRRFYAERRVLIC